jgi:hypothetical protein
VLLVLFVLALVVLIVVARSLPKSGDDDEIQAILQGAQQDRARRAAAVEQARRDLPANATIGTDWDYRPILKAFEGDQLDPLMFLVSSYVNDADGISESNAETIREALTHSHTVSAGNPFYFPFTLERTPGEELLARLCEFVRQSKPLQEIEAAQALGVLQGVVDTYRSPLESHLVNIAVLLASRAACELADGDAPRALETLLAGYAIAALLADWPHYYGPSCRYYADRVLDRVLWRFVDNGPVSAADQQRILQTLDARKPVDCLAKNLLIHAAKLEIGEESDYRGYPKPMAVAFAFTGRGALASARQLAPLLTTPPYQVRGELTTLGEHRVAGYWMNRFVDNAIRGYRMHTREAMMSDMARLAFALKEWRRQHGAYPTSLDALRPFPLADLPREPLTGDPIKYESGGDSFQLAGSSDATFWVEQYWVARR